MRPRADSDEEPERLGLEREAEQGIASTTCDPTSTGGEDLIVRVLKAALHEWRTERDAHALRAKLEAALMLAARLA